jgi:hypothetical protein
LAKPYKLLESNRAWLSGGSFASCSIQIILRKRKMQKLKSKSMAIMIAILLIISMSASIMLIPNTNAHSPPWTIISYAYLAVAPSPVGVGQAISVAMWVDTALPGATVTNPIRRAGYALTITAPDGTVSTQTWATISDSTGIQSYYFTPNQVGNYTFAFNYPGQTYIWTSSTPGASTVYTGDIFTAANATQILTVQQEPIQTPTNRGTKLQLVHNRIKLAFNTLHRWG